LNSKVNPSFKAFEGMTNL